MSTAEAAAMEKSDTADIIVGQKSGPASAGPAGPATTALRLLIGYSTARCNAITQCSHLVLY